ncbi:flagellar biosynthesis protein FlgA [Actinomyces sp. B33]|uniref:SAF domain-containing protein n=1 Tax=Actinomyces sp. B33 TaxID=2942131 RepID=UPI002341D3A9|nr:SAF domain-containing protein [Actinomyces sp. B33]MDC4232683.1 flagellar biosynthesis protein FlgA [Actinomyces sp. B33]
MKRRPRPLRIPASTPVWRDPRLVGGLLLVAVSIGLCTWLVADARSGDALYMTTRAVAQGSVLDSSNTVVVEARPGSDAYVAEGALPPGAVAARSIGAGELVARSAVSEEADASMRRLVVSVADGLPGSVEAGDLLELWSLPGRAAGGAGTAGSELVAADVALVAVVDDSSSVGRGQPRIEILVDAGSIGRVLDAVSGASALAAVPVGGR